MNRARERLDARSRPNAVRDGHPWLRLEPRGLWRTNGLHRCGHYGRFGVASFGLRAGELDHLGPLLGFVGNELAEVAGRAWKHSAAKVSKARSRPAPSVGETDDLKIERQLIFVRSAERIGIDRSSAAREQRLLVSDAALTREGCKRIRQAVRQER
jgi:hypothetical protein